MDISTKTVTTKVHTAIATPDSLKSVAILAVVRQLGLADDVVLSSGAEVLGDGSISVEVIESVPDAPASDAAPVAPAAPVVVPMPVLTGLAIPTVPAAQA